MSGASNDPGLDVLRIMRVLDHHGVGYLLVGGAAAVIHGAERQTQDFDCVAQSSQENLHRLALAMRELNARLHVEGLTDAEASTLPLALDAAMLARMEISTWRTDAGDLDILADIPDGMAKTCGSRNSLRADSAVVGGIVVRVASLDDIIASKVWADRPKDRDALPELQCLHAAQDMDPGSRPPESIPPASRPGAASCDYAGVKTEGWRGPSWGPAPTLRDCLRVPLGRALLALAMLAPVEGPGAADRRRRGLGDGRHVAAGPSLRSGDLSRRSAGRSGWLPHPGLHRPPEPQPS